MSNLQKKTLKECLSLIIDNRGKTPPKIDFGAGYKIISANHVKFDGLVRLDSIDLGSEDTYSKWMVEELKKGDILLTSEAPAGQAMLWDSDEKVIVAQRLFALRVAPLVANNKFIKYYLQSYLGQKEISRNTSGSTVFGISARMFDQINVHLPECILKQSCIGNLLYLLDKKIELNNRINAELEAMAKTLYDYWFVQFDFPDANGKPYKTAGGKMVYNETLKREIPEGWDISTLAHWINSDKTGDWGKEVSEGNYTLQVDCIRGADINGINGNGKINTPNRFILQKNEHKLLELFDLVIEISGGSPTQSTGRMAFITDDVLERFSHPIICSNFCKAISLRDNDLFYCFAYLWNNLYSNGVLFGWEGKTSGIKNFLFDAFVNKYHVPFYHQRI